MREDFATGEHEPMKPAEHIDAETLTAYRARRLEPARILALHDHAGQCGPCSQLLAGDAGAEDLAHLSEQEVVEYVAGRLSGDALDRHVLKCPECRLAVEDLRAFRQELDAGESKFEAGAQHDRKMWWLYAAAAVLLITGGSVLLNRSSLVTPPPLRDSAETTGPLAAALKDGPVPGDWPEATRQQINAALASGRLPEGPGTLRGAPGSALRTVLPEVAAFRVLAPVETRELSDRPIFRWQSLEGAADYEVIVFDPELNEVERSGKLTGTEWQPARPLPRKTPLTWQLTAQRHGESILTPRPPEAAAVFEILSEESAAEIERAKRATNPSHLALAVLYAREGLNEEARAELKQLAALNPGSSTIRALQESLLPPTAAPNGR